MRKQPKQSIVFPLITVAALAGLIAFWMGEYVYAAILFVTLVALLFWGIRGQGAQPSSRTTVRDKVPPPTNLKYPESVRAMLKTIRSLGVDPSAPVLFHPDGPISIADVADAMHVQLTAASVTPWVLVRKVQVIFDTMYEVGEPFAREHGDQTLKETVELLAAKIIEVCKLLDAPRPGKSSQVPKTDPKDIV